MSGPRVATIQQGTVTAAAQTSIGTTAGQILAANTLRRGLFIQNTGTTVLKLILGGETPTQTIYHIALAAATAADDGSGGIYVDDVWMGAVQAISSSTGGTASVVEFT